MEKFHITDLERSCYKKFDLLKLLSRKSWVSDCKLVLRLFIMLIKPKIGYRSEAYSLAKAPHLDLLKPIQNKAMQTATGVFRSLAVKSLYSVSSLKPPKSYREIKLLNLVLRILATPSNPLHDRFSSFLEANNNDEIILGNSFRITSSLHKYRLNNIPVFWCNLALRLVEST